MKSGLFSASILGLCLAILPKVHCDKSTERSEKQRNYFKVQPEEREIKVSTGYEVRDDSVSSTSEIPVTGKLPKSANARNHRFNSQNYPNGYSYPSHTTHPSDHYGDFVPLIGDPYQVRQTNLTISDVVEMLVILPGASSCTAWISCNTH